MTGGIESKKELAQLVLPWNKHLSLISFVYEGGLPMLRLRIREGRRFTDLDITAADAEAIAGYLSRWVDENPSPSGTDPE
jgi:hypothetical protein